MARFKTPEGFSGKAYNTNGRGGGIVVVTVIENNGTPLDPPLLIAENALKAAARIAAGDKTYEAVVQELQKRGTTMEPLQIQNALYKSADKSGMYGSPGTRTGINQRRGEIGRRIQEFAQTTREMGLTTPTGDISPAVQSAIESARRGRVEITMRPHRRPGTESIYDVRARIEQAGLEHAEEIILDAHVHIWTKARLREQVKKELEDRRNNIPPTE